jgi:hypothetical protein
VLQSLIRAERETAYEDPAETGKAQRPVVD